MAADAGGTALDAAWGSISPGRDAAAGLGTFTRTRVERILGIVIAVGCLLVGGQSFVAVFGATEEHGAWHPAMEIIVFVSLALMLAACFIGRAVRLFGGIFAIISLVALAVWPIATAGSTPTLDAQPWIFYLLNVATLAAVLAFPMPLQIIWTAIVPLLWGVVRLIQCGFDARFLIPVILDVTFALILGGILMTLGWVFRSVAVGVDKARARAVASYADAAAASAAEEERIAVGALMHDSVLAALIAAERAESPRERTLAVSMARDALTRLANTERDAEIGPVAPTTAAAIAAQLESAATELGSSVRVRRDVETDEQAGAEVPEVPGVVARALVLAATQAIANAIQHADAEQLAVTVTVRRRPLRVRVEVRDSGPGFELSAVPADRLGISASIQARIAAVGGQVHILSGAGGTVVTLEWAEVS